MLIALGAMFSQQMCASVGKVLPAVLAPLVLAELHADPAHLIRADLGVVQWRAPPGDALEHGQMADGLGHFRDGLHTGGTVPTTATRLPSNFTGSLGQ